MASEKNLMPRDNFLLYQEHLERQDEGDEIDASHFDKIKVELQHIDSKSSVAVVSFSHEDHTLGNPLRHVMMQSEAVTAAGYSIPHPLEPKMVLHVQAEDYAVDTVSAGLESLACMCENIRNTYEEARMTAVVDTE